jgi:hypothetical protein
MLWFCERQGGWLANGGAQAHPARPSVRNYYLAYPPTGQYCGTWHSFLQHNVETVMKTNQAAAAAAAAAGNYNQYLGPL